MTKPRVCLCLTGRTLAENIGFLEKYRPWVDMVELRADFLDRDDRLHIRRFPEMAGIPCILTIRRKIDGGKFLDGEANRSMLFARALAFADTDRAKNFAYVDFEEDFYVPSLQDAAFAFGTRVIRSCHNMSGTITDIPRKLAAMRVTGYEIPKIACMAASLGDVDCMFREAPKTGGSGPEQILCAMGPFGAPTRILAGFLNSYLTYTSPAETVQNLAEIGHIDPKTLTELYRFRNIGQNTKIFGITGFPLERTLSPAIHNRGYKAHGLDAVYIPLRSRTIAEALDFAETIGMRGLSVTTPHKETALTRLAAQSEGVKKTGACNTILRTPAGTWRGENTDILGIEQALREFLKVKNLGDYRVALIGAGGAARAAAYVVKKLKGKACVFNRTAVRAKQLADRYGFKWAVLGADSYSLLAKYSDLIIQATSKGMATEGGGAVENDPLNFYSFSGSEALYDMVYSPEVTPVMARAAAAGCRVQNGYSMLKYQGYEQFLLFTGEPYGDIESE